MTTHLDGVEYVGAIGQDIALGKLPTVTGFDTDPSNLKYATDGNMMSVTGTGFTDTGAGSGTVGFLWVDLEKLKTVLVGGIFGTWLTNAGGYIQTKQVSQISGTTYWGNELTTNSNQTEQIDANLATLILADKVGWYFFSTAGNIGNIKIYEIVALEVLL